MKSVPHFLRGPYRSAMRLAMEEATQPNPVRSEREGGVSSSCRDSCCSGLPEEATSTRTSRGNDSKLLEKVGGRIC